MWEILLLELITEKNIWHCCISTLWRLYSIFINLTDELLSFSVLHFKNWMKGYGVVQTIQPALSIPYCHAVKRTCAMVWSQLALASSCCLYLLPSLCSLFKAQKSCSGLLFGLSKNILRWKRICWQDRKANFLFIR